MTMLVLGAAAPNWVGTVARTARGALLAAVVISVAEHGSPNSSATQYFTTIQG